VATCGSSLSCFAPDQQGRGIGQELLQRTFQHAMSAKAATKALITFAFNGVSQGLYMRHGLFSRCLIYNVEISREALMRSLPEGELRCVPLDGTALHLDSLARIDARVLGVSRARHHRFLMNDGGTRGVLLYAEDECVGCPPSALVGQIQRVEEGRISGSS
jgi:hypothetical protein